MLDAAAAGLIASTGAWAVEISVSCSALGKEYEICKQGVDAWAKNTGNTVKIVSTPNSATERLALYQQLFGAGASDIVSVQRPIRARPSSSRRLRYTANRLASSGSTTGSAA